MHKSLLHRGYLKRGGHSLAPYAATVALAALASRAWRSVGGGLRIPDLRELGLVQLIAVKFFTMFGVESFEERWGRADEERQRHYW